MSENYSPNQAPWNRSPLLEIPITIGEHSINYVVVLTNASESYDGFGTFTIETLGFDDRLVLVDKQQLDWQSSRYASGMRKCVTDIGTDFDVDSVRQNIISSLRKRLIGTQE